MKTIIFTDLDGTLLDSKNYSFKAAEPALDLIRKRDIPLIICSSKTRAEIELYRRRLGNRHPFISENGGGVFAPPEYFPLLSENALQSDLFVTVLGLPYERVRKEFDELKKRFQATVAGFGDMTVEEISQLTGLPHEEAALARARDFSEPFLFREDVDQAFLKGVEERGLHWTQGKFYCLMGEHDKGRAAAIVKRLYEKAHGKIITMALGDALNDLPLLLEADHAVLVQKEDGTYDPRINLPGLHKAPGPGPEGWNKAVLDFLNR